MKKYGLLLVLISIASHSNAFEKYKQSTKSKNNLSFLCAKKMTCKKIKSCEEAQFYFKECGFKRLDRDKDNIPCEKLCN